MNCKLYFDHFFNLIMVFFYLFYLRWMNLLNILLICINWIIIRRISFLISVWYSINLIKLTFFFIINIIFNIFFWFSFYDDSQCIVSKFSFFLYRYIFKSIKFGLLHNFREIGIRKTTPRKIHPNPSFIIIVNHLRFIMIVFKQDFWFFLIFCCFDISLLIIYILFEWL